MFGRRIVCSSLTGLRMTLTKLMVTAKGPLVILVRMASQPTTAWLINSGCYIFPDNRRAEGTGLARIPHNS